MGVEKYRSLVDYAAIQAGDREGINLGLDAALFVRRELTRGVFNPPRIGTQGSSAGAVSASTDISAGTDDSLDIAVDGGAVVTVTLTLAGLTTGALIEAELESKINSALAADGQDARVWVDFDAGAPDQYTIYSQKTGTSSSVVVTDASSDNVADDLGLGVANGGTESAGTDDQDFLLYTTNNPTFEQPVESNAHRSGRYHSGIVKQKKVVNVNFDAMVNMSGSAGDSLDNAIRLMLQNVFADETVNAGVSLEYNQGEDFFFYSLVRVSTIFGEYYTGCYNKDYTLTLPGDAAATQSWSGGRGADQYQAGIGIIDGAVVSSATVVLSTSTFNHSERFTANARVMVVDTDGRTILAGADGSLSILTVDTGTATLTLSAAIDAADTAYIVPWNPGAVQQTGRDNIFTDLEGSIKLTSTGSEICVTNIELALTNDHNDFDNCFGEDTNAGFAAGNRATWALSVTFDLSGENYGEVVQSRKFEGLAPEIILGDSSGRHLKITAPNWIVSVPPIELPENGPTPVTLTGNLYQSQPGARDPVKFEFL